MEYIAALLKIRQGNGPRSPVTWDDPLFWNVEADRPARCQFLTVGNAMNFRFWQLEDGRVLPSVGLIEGLEHRGSMYMWRRLRVAVSRGEFCLDADFLANLTIDHFKRAFADDNGTCPLGPALDDRVKNLRDLGTRLIRRWGGEFVNVLDGAERSLKAFAQLSSAFRAFDDPVRKLTMVNAIMHIGSGLVSFDEDPLPGIDYHLVKQALRQGLVMPPPALEEKLVAGHLLDADESLALRRATLDALVEVGSRAAIPTTVLDNSYWLNRRVCRDPIPACADGSGEPCPFEMACAQRTSVGMPLEITRYY